MVRVGEQLLRRDDLGPRAAQAASDPEGREAVRTRTVNAVSLAWGIWELCDLYSTLLREVPAVVSAAVFFVTAQCSLRHATNGVAGWTITRDAAGLQCWAL